MAKRVQSPSSINTYKQCPRKYYYQYIEKIETKTNIHQLRGTIVHSVLDNFYNLNLPGPEEDYQKYFTESIQKLLVFYWKKAQQELDSLGLNSDQKLFYFEETMFMVMNWVKFFLNDLTKEMSGNLPLKESFFKLTPIREQKFQSESYSVQGFIDAIHFYDSDIHIIDYKTNAKQEITEEQKLQLGIYSLLYNEKYQKYPSKVGIFFLRNKLKLLDFNEELINLAKEEIRLIHLNTLSDNIQDYPCKLSPLCKWSSGCCDFYKICNPHNQKS